ncbi:MAG: hypothetical protein DMF80_11300 [Acidobacteria bacterium]|nr:MAG: hypothetical protein DMF80_11300 [Acidobacteriota bacterium]
MRFLAAFLGVLAALGILYAAAARLVDPHGDFGTGVFPVINMDARAQKMQLFREALATTAPEGLILGSSRAMKVRPRTLEAATGRRFFNFAVDNARAEDYLAIYRWVREQRVRVRFLVIGLDVEALHSDDRPEADLIRNDALMRTLAEGTLREPGLLAPVRKYPLAALVKKYKATFTIEYASDTVRALRLAARPGSQPLPMMEFEPDGYLRYRRWEVERAAGTFRFDQDLERCLTKYLNRFDSMTELSGRRRAYLRQVVDEALADGARVLIWITSLHPLTTHYLEAHTSYGALLEATREYEQAIKRSRDVAIYDFSAPESYDGTPFGWYDCAHIDESNANLVAAALAREMR